MNLGYYYRKRGDGEDISKFLQLTTSLFEHHLHHYCLVLSSPGKKKFQKLLSKTHETPWSPELPVDLARRGTWEEVCLLLCGEQLGKNPGDSVAYLDIIINSWHLHILKTTGQLHFSTLLRSQFTRYLNMMSPKEKSFAYRERFTRRVVFQHDHRRHEHHDHLHHDHHPHDHHHHDHHENLYKGASPVMLSSKCQRGSQR